MLTGPTDQPDIRMFLTKGGKNAKQTILHASNEKNLTFSIPQETEDPIDKMRMIRNKMVKDAILVKKQHPATWRGQTLTHARDVDNARVQDDLELVVVGADMEQL